MSRSVKFFLFLSGAWLFFSWGFRFYILVVRWGTNPSWKAPLFWGLIFFLMGGVLIFIGRLGDKATSRHYGVMIISSLFMIVFWMVRVMNFVFSSVVDPNPRSHLHLAVTSLVFGVLLGLTGWRGLKRSGPKGVLLASRPCPGG